MHSLWQPTATSWCLYNPLWPVENPVSEPSSPTPTSGFEHPYSAVFFRPPISTKLLPIPERSLFFHQSLLGARTARWGLKFWFRLWLFSWLAWSISARPTTLAISATIGPCTPTFTKGPNPDSTRKIRDLSSQLSTGKVVCNFSFIAFRLRALLKWQLTAKTYVHKMKVSYTWTDNHIHRA